MESQVQAMVAVADTGSFTLAARRLGLTPSGISKLVSRLEGRLKTRLFQRTTRRVQLTEAGQRYADRARRILAELDELEREASERSEPRPRGLLRITAPPVFGELRVMPVLDRLLKRWPELTASIDLTDRVVDVVAEGFDVAVRFAMNPVPKSWTARFLMPQQRMLVASPAYLKRGIPRTPADLARHDHVVFFTSGRIANTLRVYEKPGSTKLVSVPITGRIQVDASRAELRAALDGLGIADIDAYVAREHLKAGRLVELLPGCLPVERNGWLMHAPGPYVPPKVRVFVEAMVERVNNEA